MKRKVPFNSTIPKRSDEKYIEKRVVVDENGVSSIVDFDSTQLDLGDIDIYDLTNMLRAGVQPGKAVPHDVSPLDGYESASVLVDNIIKANPQENIE